MTTRKDKDDGDGSDKARAVKITNQFRSRTGFVYDLKCDGQRLVLRIGASMHEPQDGWHVQAASASADDTPSVEAYAPTRADALREVGRRWADSGGPNFPAFDWEAVEKALTAVRAL